MTAEAVGKQIVDVLSTLAEKLEGPAAHVYEVYVRQVWMEGMMYIVGAVVLIVIGMLVSRLFAARTAYHAGRSRENPPDRASWERSESERVDAAVNENRAGTAVSALVGVAISVAPLTAGVLRLWNPEFYAIKRLIDTIT